VSDTEVATPTTTEEEDRGWLRNLADRPQTLGTLGVAAIVVLLFIIGGITTPAFLTSENVVNIVRAASLTGIVALGMTFITISGNFFSLSVQQTAAAAAITYAATTGWGWPLGLAILGTLALAGAIGLGQGSIIAVGANPIITTLGAGAAIFGLSAFLTDNRTIRVGDTSSEWIGRGQPLGIPTQSWAFVLLTIVAMIVLSRTRFGRSVTLVGANSAAAVASGISKGFVAMAVFAVSALAAGLAGIFLAAQIGQGIVNQFATLNIDSIAAVLVGGTAVQGGDGSMLRTAVGTLFIAVLINLTLLRGYSFGMRIFLEGVAVTIGVSVFTLLRNRTGS
jgi:simple sugar transport system permease protein/ribose transport system permease protein